MRLAAIAGVVLLFAAPSGTDAAGDDAVNANDVSWRKNIAIYETWRKEETPLLCSVTWLTPNQTDDMTAAAMIETERYTDTIYISDDTKERIVAGMRFSGKITVVRKESSSGSVLYVSKNN